MRKKFLLNLVFLVFLNFLVKPFWVFGIDRGVQNVVGPSEYGFYFTILNFAFIFQILLDFGITNYNNRNIAQNNHLLSKHFSSIIILRFIFAFLYMAVILIAGWLWNYSNYQLFLLSIIGINQFLLSFILYLRSNISALLLFKTDSFLSILDRLIMISICSILLWGNIFEGTFKITWFIFAQTVAYIITAITAFSILLSKMDFKKLNWNSAFFIVTIKKSLPYALLILLMGLYSRVDTVLIEKLSQNGELQSGIYASAFRLLDVANNMSGYLFASLLLPIFAKLIKEKHDLNQLIKLTFSLLFLFSTTVAIIAFFYGENIIEMLYSQHITESISSYNERILETTSILQILMIVFVFTSTTYIFGTLLTAKGDLKQLNKIAFFGVLVSFGLNILLIPYFQAIGSAWASFGAQGITAILQVFLAIKCLSITFERNYISKLFLFLLITAAVAWFSVDIHIFWIQKILLLAIIAIFTAFILKLLRIKAFINILQNEN